MITLYTPATGFPDLEAKIAYGLARIGIEAGSEVSLKPCQGFYEISYRFEKDENFVLNEVFTFLLKRLLPNPEFYDLGVKARYKSKYLPNLEVLKRLSNVNLAKLYSDKLIHITLDFFNLRLCKHKKLTKFGSDKENKSQKGGLILLASNHAGKPYVRDKIQDVSRRDTLGLCEVCGYLSVLGGESFSFTIQLGKGKNKKFVKVLPIPTKQITNLELITILAIQKRLHNYWLSDLMPLKTFTIGLLSKIPSLSEVINKIELNFYLALLSKDNRGDTVVEQIALVDAISFSDFISYSPYNSATVINLLGDYKLPPKISTLLELTNALEQKAKSSLLKFARLYVQETSSNNFTNLLYPQTAKYLLEVTMIKPEIIENPALLSLARTLRYFIRERKYGYADDIRNARKDSKDFEETIVKMLREAELRRVQQEQDKNSGKEVKNWVRLPNEEEIKEIFRLANEDFDQVKTALVMLAFSFPTKKEEKNE